MPNQESLSEQYKEIAGANKFLAEHCKKTMESFWKLLRGVEHSTACCHAEYAELLNEVKKLKARCDALEQSRSDSNAEIGKLQEAIEGARKAWIELKRQQ